MQIIPALLTLMTRLSSDCGGFPVHTANLHESSAICSVTPNSGVYKENITEVNNKLNTGKVLSKKKKTCSRGTVGVKSWLEPGLLDPKSNLQTIT